MAVALVAGLVSVGGAIIAQTGINLFVAFAIGAGLSMVSRALMPSPDLGSQMSGRSVTSRDAAHSRKIVYGRARIGGNIVYLESTGTDNKYLWLVIAVAGHEIDAFEEVWFNDVKIWDGSFVGSWGNYVSIGFYKGDQTTADNASQRGAASLVSNSTKWTDNHKLLDTAYMVVKLTYDIDQFANGLPNISTVVRGKKVLNPATSTTAWSENPALCVYDYLRDTKYGLGESVGNILTSSVNAAATVCDETVALAAGGTQKRYTIDGVVDTAGSIKDNINTMLGSMIGRLVFSAGKFEIYAGEYVAPTYSVDESVAVGDISIQTKQSRRNAYNGVKGVFLSEDDNYILADYPAQLSSTFAAADGDPIYLDMPLPFTVNNVRAQRIAKLAMFRSRQQEAITIPCNLSALRFKIGDNINVTNARLGYSNKVFEVVGYTMDFTAEGQIVVNVDAIETAPSIWDWNTSDEEVYLGAGEVELYDGLTAAAPTSLNITGDSFLNSDGTFNTAFNVAWTDADDAFTDHYVVEWKKASETNYFTMDAKASPAVITGLQNNQQYNVRVKAVNEIGVSSTYIVAAPTAAVDTTAPDAPTSVSADGEFEQITISWTNATASDLKHVNVYGSNSEFSGFSLIGESAGTTFTEVNLLVGATRYYKLRSVDKSGNATKNAQGQPEYSQTVNATTTQVPAGGIAPLAVGTGELQGGAVTTPKIDDDAVTTAKIATTLESTNYVSGTSGWKIEKSGVVEFEQATIRGDVSATSGSISGTVTIGGTAASTVVAGAGDGASALQDSDTNVNLGLTGGTISGITISGTKLYEGAGTFNNSNTGFYLDNTGQFSLKDKLSFNGTTLSVSGNIVANSLNVTGATVTGSFDANNLPNLQSMNGVITVNQINANTITVDKLSGDVSETFPVNYISSIGQCSGNSVTDNDARLTVPAPTGGVQKNAAVSLTVKMSANCTFTSGTSTTVASCDLILQRLSTGITTGTAIGATVTQVTSLPNNVKRLTLVGNHINNLGTIGSISRSSTGASGFTVTPVLGYYYANTVTGYSGNFTYVFTDSSTDITVGSTFYFNKDAWEAQGTWVSSATYERVYFQVQPQDTVTKDYTIHETFGKTLVGENFRLTAKQYENTSFSNTPITIHSVSGAMQLIT